MALTKEQQKALRGFAQGINPTILIGAKGISEGLVAELEQTLNHHELIKIKIASDDRAYRAQLQEEILRLTQADEVQTIGKTFSIFRQRPQDSNFNLKKL